MIYVICIKGCISGKILSYRVFDTHSNSEMDLTTDQLKGMISNNLVKVANARLQNNEIIIKHWVNGIAKEERVSNSEGVTIKQSGPKYVLLTRGDNTCKLVNYEGSISIVNDRGLCDMVALDQVANYGTTQTDDVYTLQKDKEFENRIQLKYNSFTAKAIFLLEYGDVAFYYEIENREVRLKSYNGKSKDVIIPPFITAITKFAFKSKGIETIKFSEGLKVIGQQAFYPAGKSSGFTHVEIPSTVGLIAKAAFMANNRLAYPNGILHKERFKLLSDKTIVLDQWIN